MQSVFKIVKGRSQSKRKLGTNLVNCQSRHLNAADWINLKIPFTLDVEGNPCCPLGKMITFLFPKTKTHFGLVACNFPSMKRQCAVFFISLGILCRTSLL